MGHHEKLTILSEPANLAKVRLVVEAGGKEAGFDQKACAAMALAVDEALTNVIRHAYDNKPDKKIEVNIERVNETNDRQGLMISIRDFGKHRAGAEQAFSTRVPKVTLYDSLEEYLDNLTKDGRPSDRLALDNYEAEISLRAYEPAAPACVS